MLNVVYHYLLLDRCKYAWKHAWTCNGPLARNVKLRVAHAPGMSGTFSPPPRVSDPDMHHDTCVTHVPWCMPGSLTSGFHWNRWWRKRSRHSRCMRNPQFYVSGNKGANGQLSIVLTGLIFLRRSHTWSFWAYFWYDVVHPTPNILYRYCCVLNKYVKRT